MPTVCHFEIPADDIEKIKKFYAGLFGWKIEQAEEFSDYWLIGTTDASGEKGVGGAIEKRQSPEHRITINFDVPSVEEYTAKVEQLGGKVFVSKTAVPGIGYYAYCVDPEGNYFVIWETDKAAE